MRISDWSSYFCSSDLRNLLVRSGPERRSFHCIFYFKNDVLRNCNRVLEVCMNLDSSKTKGIGRVAFRGPCMHKGGEESPIHPRRSEERRVGKECVRRSRSRWWRYD